MGPLVSRSHSLSFRAVASPTVRLWERPHRHKTGCMMHRNVKNNNEAHRKRRTGILHNASDQTLPSEEGAALAPALPLGHTPLPE